MAIWRSCLLAGVALALVAAANADTHHHASPGNFEVEQSDIFCKEYENSNEATLDVEESPSVRSGMRVFDRFDVTDVKVSFNLTYTRMGALNIALQALEPREDGNNQPDWSPLMRSATLMSREGRKQTQLTDIGFEDAAEEMYPHEVNENQDLPPATGTFKPRNPLHTIAYGQSDLAGMGGSRGWWRLVVRDVGDTLAPRTGTLSGWKLTLCGRNLPEMPSDEFIQETITGLPEGAVPEGNAFVNPANSTAPAAIAEVQEAIDETALVVDPDYDVTEDSAEPIENTFADDSPIRNGAGAATTFMPIWEYATAWSNRIAIRLGFRI